MTDVSGTFRELDARPVCLWVGEAAPMAREALAATARVETCTPDEALDRTAELAPDLLVVAGETEPSAQELVLGLRGGQPGASVPVVALEGSGHGAPRPRSRFGLVATIGLDETPEEIARHLLALGRGMSRRTPRWKSSGTRAQLPELVQQLRSEGRTGFLVVEGSGRAIALGSRSAAPDPERVAAMLDDETLEVVLRERPAPKVRLLRSTQGGEVPRSGLAGTRIVHLDPDGNRGPAVDLALVEAGAEVHSIAPDEASLQEAKLLDPTLIVVREDVLTEGTVHPLWTEPRLGAASVLVVASSGLSDPPVAAIVRAALDLSADERALSAKLEAGEVVTERLETLGAARWMKVLGRCTHPVRMTVVAAGGHAVVDLSGGRMQDARLSPSDPRAAPAEGRKAVDALVPLPFGRVMAGPQDALAAALADVDPVTAPASVAEPRLSDPFSEEDEPPGEVVRDDAVASAEESAQHEWQRVETPSPPARPSPRPAGKGAYASTTPQEEAVRPLPIAAPGASQRPSDRPRAAARAPELEEVVDEPASPGLGRRQPTPIPKDPPPISSRPEGLRPPAKPPTAPDRMEARERRPRSDEVLDGELVGGEDRLRRSGVRERDDEGPGPWDADLDEILPSGVHGGDIPGIRIHESSEIPIEVLQAARSKDPTVARAEEAAAAAARRAVRSETPPALRMDPEDLLPPKMPQTAPPRSDQSVANKLPRVERLAQQPLPRHPTLHPARPRTDFDEERAERERQREEDREAAEDEKTGRGVGMLWFVAGVALALALAGISILQLGDVEALDPVREALGMTPPIRRVRPAPAEDPTGPPGEDAPPEDPTGEDPTGEDPTDEDPTDEDPTDEDPTDEDPTAAAEDPLAAENVLPAAGDPDAPYIDDPEAGDRAVEEGEQVIGEEAHAEFEASETADHVRSAEPEIQEQQVAALLTLAVAAHRRRDFAAEEDLARQILVREPTNGAAAYRLALSLYRQQRFAQALGWAVRAAEWDPEDYLSVALQGDIYTATGELNLAARAYSTCLERNLVFAPCRGHLDDLLERGATLE